MRLLLILAALIVPGFALRADDTKEFLDPKNWKGLEQYWKIEGTSVTGTAKVDPKFNTFLCSQAKYSDFELSFKVRLVDGKGNSGIQIRSLIADEKKYVVHGAQCDMGQQYWGSLYGEGVGGMMKACPGDFVMKHVKSKDFNDYSIVAKGNKVTIKVNGEVSVDAEFPMTPNKKELPSDGIIAFQLHQGGPMTVEFTDIKFMNLAKKAK